MPYPISSTLADDILQGRVSLPIEIESVAPDFYAKIIYESLADDYQPDPHLFVKGTAFYALKSLLDILSKHQSQITFKFIPAQIKPEIGKILNLNANPALNNILKQCQFINQQDGTLTSTEFTPIYRNMEDDDDEFELIDESGQVNTSPIASVEVKEPAETQEAFNSDSEDEEFGAGEEFDQEGNMLNSVTNLPPLIRTDSNASSEHWSSPRSSSDLQASLSSSAHLAASTDDISELQNELALSTSLLIDAEKELKKSQDEYDLKLKENSETVRKLHVQILLKPTTVGLHIPTKLPNGTVVDKFVRKQLPTKKSIFIADRLLSDGTKIPKTKPTPFSPAKEYLTYNVNDRMPTFDAMNAAQQKIQQLKDQQSKAANRLLTASCPSTFWAKTVNSPTAKEFEKSPLNTIAENQASSSGSKKMV
jgi:hypothetical protein